MAARVICLVCYRNLLGAEYGHREALATSRRCLWDWEHEPVVPVEQAKAAIASVSEGPVFEGQSVLGAFARVYFAKKREREELRRQEGEDAEIEAACDLIGAELDDGEPRPAS